MYENLAVLAVFAFLYSTVAGAIIGSSPDLNYDNCFVMVFNWLYLGAKTAFLQDANTVIMPTGQLLEVLRHLTGSFPTLERITSYARSKTLARKSLDELKDLRQAGLTRLHVGLETGDDAILADMEKGVTAAGHIDAGKKAKASAAYELAFQRRKTYGKLRQGAGKCGDLLAFWVFT